MRSFVIPADIPKASVPDISGWVPMRTVAEVRRELGIGAPREKNSLYRPIERGPRKFNPLKIPKQLQVGSMYMLQEFQTKHQMTLHVSCKGWGATDKCIHLLSCRFAAISLMSFYSFVCPPMSCLPH